MSLRHIHNVGHFTRRFMIDHDAFVVCGYPHITMTIIHHVTNGVVLGIVCAVSRQGNHFPNRLTLHAISAYFLVHDGEQPYRMVVIDK